MTDHIDNTELIKQLESAMKEIHSAEDEVHVNPAQPMEVVEEGPFDHLTEEELAEILQAPADVPRESLPEGDYDNDYMLQAAVIHQDICDAESQSDISQLDDITTTLGNRVPVWKQNLCWRCGHAGHRRNVCQRSPVLFCSRCGRRGRMSRACSCPLYEGRFISRGVQCNMGATNQIISLARPSSFRPGPLTKP